MAVSINIQKPPLGVDQAVGILETLSLLGAEQHKASKIVYYDTKIALEQDSPTWRTVSSWTSSVTSTVTYYAGYSPEMGCRELSCLPPLVERVHVVLVEQQNIPVDLQSFRRRQDLVEKAETGLLAIKTNRYQGKEEKTKLVDAALLTVGKIKTFHKEKYDELLRKTMEEMRNRGRPEQEAKEMQAAQKDQEMIRLKEKVAHLEQLIEKDKANATNWLTLLERTKQTAEAEIAAPYKQRITDLELFIAKEHETNQNWVQLLATKEQEYSRKLAEKEQLLAGMVLSNTVDLEKVPTKTVLAMSRVLLDTLAGRHAQS